MKVFSVHERPLLTYKGDFYHPYLNVITKYFALADKISYGVSDLIEISEEKAKKLVKIENKNIEFIRLYRINSLKSLLVKQQKNREILEKEIRNSDIVVARLPSFTGLQAVKIAKRLNKPYMVEAIGCAWDGYWNYNIKGKFLAPFLFLKMRKAFRDASHAVYVTDKFLQDRYPCKGQSIGASNVHIYPNSEDILTIKLQNIDNLNFHGVIKLATAAAIDNPLKGQQYVFEAIAKLKIMGYKFHYYLLGGGNPIRLKSLAENLGIEEQVHFIGQLSQEEVIKFMSQIDIYVQPSKQEGLPRALIEAMHQACPAIGSRIAGIPELISPECLFKKGDVKSIIRILSKMTKDKMKKYAQENYKTSLKYEIQTIEKHRNEFFKKFLEFYNLKN